MFNLKEFKIRFERFKKFDYQSYPYCFGEFWKWKLRVENEGHHILDDKNIEKAYDRLSKTLKIWQWHRPYSFSMLAKRLKESLKRIGNAYNEIREYSLLEFDKIPREPLEFIWHELGWVKTFEKNNRGYYLAMATTKPFMFLWGQTPAFDSVVRQRMPRFGIIGLADNHWSFERWRNVLLKFQEILKQRPEIVDLFQKTSLKEYRARTLVPYGQFIDLYYWVRCW